MAALLDLFNELEKMRRARASSSLSSIALIVGCYSMIHLGSGRGRLSIRTGLLGQEKKLVPTGKIMRIFCW